MNIKGLYDAITENKINYHMRTSRLKPHTVKIAFVLMLLSFSHFIKAQSAVEGVFAEISTLLKSQTTYKEAPFVAYNTIGKELQINDYLLPVKKDVQLVSDTKKEKDKPLALVRFYYQKGLAVTSVKDKTYRKAYFELNFANEKDAGEFIRLFNQLKDPA